MRLRTVACVVAASSVVALVPCPSRAQSTPERPPPAQDSGGSGGAKVAGVAVIIVGAGAVVAGSAVLLAGTLEDKTQTQQAELSVLHGSNGRGTSQPAPDPSQDTTGFDRNDAAAVMLGAGAAVMGIGIAILWMGGSGRSETARTTAHAPLQLQPVVGPGAAGVRLRF